jgi:hypothetical protein
LWDAALAIDPTMKRLSEPGKYGSAEALLGLMHDAGLTNITGGELTMPCQFSSFGDLWQGKLTGEGLNSAYVLGLQHDHREALKKRLRQNVLGDGADGPFSLKAKAWAVRGVVP